MFSKRFGSVFGVCSYFNWFWASISQSIFLRQKSIVLYCFLHPKKNAKSWCIDAFFINLIHWVWIHFKGLLIIHFNEIFYL